MENNIKLIITLTFNQAQYEKYKDDIANESWFNSYLFIPTNPGAPNSSYFIHPNFYLTSYLSNIPNSRLTYQEAFNYFKNLNLEIETEIILTK